MTESIRRRPISFDELISAKPNPLKVRERIYKHEGSIKGHGGSYQATIQPDIIFRLTDVTVTLANDSPANTEIEYVLVGNVIQSMFAKRTTTAAPDVQIRVHLVNYGDNEELVKVTVKGIELAE